MSHRLTILSLLVVEVEEEIMVVVVEQVDFEQVQGLL
jgi:hypothetical protein